MTNYSSYKLDNDLVCKNTLPKDTSIWSTLNVNCKDKKKLTKDKVDPLNITKRHLIEKNKPWAFNRKWY